MNIEEQKMFDKGKIQGVRDSTMRILEMAVDLRERQGLHHDASIMADMAKALEIEQTRLKTIYEDKYKEKLVL